MNGWMNGVRWGKSRRKRKKKAKLNIKRMTEYEWDCKAKWMASSQLDENKRSSWERERRSTRTAFFDQSQRRIEWMKNGYLILYTWVGCFTILCPIVTGGREFSVIGSASVLGCICSSLPSSFLMEKACSWLALIHFPYSQWHAKKGHGS